MIQIDMPMPDSCAECPLKTVEEDLYGDHFYYCPIIKAVIRGKKRNIKRFRHCPLKEVAEPKARKKANCTDAYLTGRMLVREAPAERSMMKYARTF